MAFKNLGRYGLAFVLALQGCDSNEKYHFDGELNGRHVKFIDSFLGAPILAIENPDGSKIRYIETNDYPTTLSSVEIEEDGVVKSYNSGIVFQEADKQNKQYLFAILKFNEDAEIAKHQHDISSVGKFDPNRQPPQLTPEKQDQK